MGLKKPNAWGLYDILGNVREWVDDRAAYYDYEPLPELSVDPKGPQRGRFGGGGGGPFTDGGVRGPGRPGLKGFGRFKGKASDQRRRRSRRSTRLPGRRLGQLCPLLAALISLLLLRHGLKGQRHRLPRGQGGATECVEDPHEETEVGFSRSGPGLLGICIPLSAHHSFQAEYDDQKPITLTGKVTKISPDNPHGWIYLDVMNEKGRVINWALELPPPNVLQHNGFDTSVYKAMEENHEEITVTAFQAKDGAKHALLGSGPHAQRWQDRHYIGRTSGSTL